MSSENPTLEEALSYGKRGWRVIPVWPPSASLAGSCQCPKRSECKSPGKHPMGNAWQHRASADAEQITKWFSERTDLNVGVMFGEGSGIVDVECDSPEAEAELQRMLGDDPPVCPTFQARRGKHRLFKWQPGLPAKAALTVRGVEFRLGNEEKGAQSVFPPSKHATGAVYSWLPGLTPDDVDPAPMPEKMVAALLAEGGVQRNGMQRNTGKSRRVDLNARYQKGERNNELTKWLGRKIRKLGDLADLDLQAMTIDDALNWNERHCVDDPLDEDEVKNTVASIMGLEVKHRAELMAARVTRTPTAKRWRK